MKLRREFTGPVSAEDALARLEKLMKIMKYKQADNPTHLEFERGRNLSSLYAMRPRSFQSFLHIWIEGFGPESSKITIEQEVPKVFQPPHHLAEVFLEGELDDIQKGILTNTPSDINRIKENKMAGTAHFVYLVCAVAISFAFARIFGTHDNWLTITAWIIAFLAMVYFEHKLPFELIEFKVRLPRGAKIIPDPEPERAPIDPKSKSAKA